MNSKDTVKNAKAQACSHSSREMTDYLAGELGEKESGELGKRLVSCEACRADFAKMEKAWNLAGEVLKGAAVNTTIASDTTHPAPAKKTPASTQVKTKIIDKKVKSATTFPNWVLEIAACFIVMFLIALLLPALSMTRESARSKSMMIQKLGGGGEDFSCSPSVASDDESFLGDAAEDEEGAYEIVLGLVPEGGAVRSYGGTVRVEGRELSKEMPEPGAALQEMPASELSRETEASGPRRQIMEHRKSPSPRHAAKAKKQEDTKDENEKADVAMEMAGRSVEVADDSLLSPPILQSFSQIDAGRTVPSSPRAPAPGEPQFERIPAPVTTPPPASRPAEAKASGKVVGTDDRADFDYDAVAMGIVAESRDRSEKKISITLSEDAKDSLRRREVDKQLETKKLDTFDQPADTSGIAVNQPEEQRKPAGDEFKSRAKPVLVTKTLKANLKMWDLDKADSIVDFLRKNGVTAEGLKFKVDGDSVTFTMPKAELEKVEKIFFDLNRAEEKLKDTSEGLPFIRTEQKQISTFSIDVDTASYTRCVQAIRAGRRPASDAVRGEEFINYFDYHYRSPAQDVFSVELEAAPSFFRSSNTTLRIGVQGKRLGAELDRPTIFTLLIDTSGSMGTRDRLGLVKDSLPMLLDQLESRDRVTVVACGSQPTILLYNHPADDKDAITEAVKMLEPVGVTNIEAGIIEAYRHAASNYVSGGYNRVLVFTDGVSNISQATAEEILKSVEKYRQKGVTNTVISVGGDGDDSFLKTLASKGDGNYVFLEALQRARELFEDQFSASFREIARDVKIQVEFNPRWVPEYRQVGYEKRQLSASQFRDDTVDAGEVGAGQSVTALYELKVHQIIPMARQDSMIYPPPDMTFATVRLRYRRADTMEIEEREFSISLPDILPNSASASPGFRLAASVAEFAENLRYPDTGGIANTEIIRKTLRPLIAGVYAEDSKVKELDTIVGMVE